MQEKVIYFLDWRQTLEVIVLIFEITEEGG